MDTFMQAAIQEARSGLAEGGIPIGAVLVINGKIVGRGHNRRVQKGSAVLHAEMDCLEHAGRLSLQTITSGQRCILRSPRAICAAEQPCCMIKNCDRGTHHVPGT